MSCSVSLATRFVKGSKSFESIVSFVAGVFESAGLLLSAVVGTLLSVEVDTLVPLISPIGSSPGPPISLITGA